MPTVSTNGDAYQDLDRIRERIDYQGADFFEDNAALRFDELLVELERESRGIFETLWGDETPLEELERVDVIRATDDAALPLVYPIQQIREVEVKRTLNSDWETLEANRYDSDEHRLILAVRPTSNSLRLRRRGNVLRRFNSRATWRDVTTKLRVTYDRGFGSEVPQDIQSVQIQLIENLLRKLEADQTIAAGSPQEMAEAIDTDMVVTDEVRARISDVTSPGRATMSI